MDQGVWARLELDEHEEFLCHRTLAGPQKPLLVVRLRDRKMPTFEMVPRWGLDLFTGDSVGLPDLSRHWKILTADAVQMRSYFGSQLIANLVSYRGWHIQAQDAWICVHGPTAWDIPSPDDTVEFMTKARALVHTLLKQPRETNRSGEE